MNPSFYGLPPSSQHSDCICSSRLHVLIVMAYVHRSFLPANVVILHHDLDDDVLIQEAQFGS